MAWCTQHPSRYHFHVGLEDTTNQKQRSEHHNHIKRDLYIRVVDTTPWLGDPRYRGGGKYGEIEYEADENGHATTYYRPLGCFTTENDPAADIGVPYVRLLSATTSSIESYAIARDWLAQCLATEFRVNPVITNSDASGYILDVCDDHAWGEADIQLEVDGDPLAPEIPRRLVDLQPDGLSSCQKRVVAIDNLAIIYATLSYCWGDIYDRAWLTNRGNLAQRTFAFDVKSMPKTVRESFAIVSKLGIRYIWIDALCIVQDDEMEWAEESARMGGIYRGSVVTIAVPSSQSVDQGCFNTHSRSHFDKFGRLHRVNSVLRSGASSSIYIYGQSRPDLHEQEIAHGPWVQRGWTFQEQIFARRVIYYSESQLFWQCEHCRLTEDNLGILDPLTTYNQLYPVMRIEHQLKGHSLLSWWYLDLVKEYSSRTLTFNSDRLVALSALAKATYLNKRVEYLAGIWKDSVLTGLLWRRVGRGGKAQAYRCPSWSWLSQDSAVSYELACGRLSQDVLARQRRERLKLYDGDPQDVDTWHDGPFAKVLHASTTTDPINPFGAVKDGCIEIETRVVVALRTSDVLSRSWIRESSDGESLIFPSGSPNGYQGIAYMDNDDSGTGNVVCALLTARLDRFVFLLLELVEPATSVYKRIGIAEAERDELAMIQMEQVTITII